MISYIYLPTHIHHISLRTIIFVLHYAALCGIDARLANKSWICPGMSHRSYLVDTCRTRISREM